MHSSQSNNTVSRYTSVWLRPALPKTSSNVSGRESRSIQQKLGFQNSNAAKEVATQLDKTALVFHETAAGLHGEHESLLSRFFAEGDRRGEIHLPGSSVHGRFSKDLLDCRRLGRERSFSILSG